MALLAVVASSCTNSTTSSPITPAPPAAAMAPANMSPPTPVSLTAYFNDRGIYADGVSFSGGIDGDGFACSSNLLGATVTCGGVLYQLGSAINGSNVISCHGQTLSLPAGNYSRLQMLALAVNGAQADQAFALTYADNSSQSFTQSFSDWAQPDSNSGETQAITMDYRLQTDGTKDENSYYIFSYSFALNSAKTVQSLKLPDNDNVRIFAVTLVP
jgi:hypothetical protein